MASKICKTCGIEKDLSEFHKSSVGNQGRVAHCKDCMNWMKRSSESKQLYLELKEFSEKGLRRCGHCKEVKSISDFPHNKKGRDGLHSHCFDCSRSLGLEYVRRPEIKQRKKEKESTREFLDNLAVYRQQNEKYKKRTKEYQQSSKFKEYQAEYNQRIDVRLRGKISVKIYSALKAQDEEKMLEFDEYLGCTIKFFKVYIANLFQEGMSWENWGRGKDKWHIDHIKPCASFNFKDMEQQKLCFHYSNQQPLWEHDNLSKSSKLGGIKRYHKRNK